MGVASVGWDGDPSDIGASPTVRGRWNNGDYVQGRCQLSVLFRIASVGVGGSCEAPSCTHLYVLKFVQKPQPSSEIRTKQHDACDLQQL